MKRYGYSIAFATISLFFLAGFYTVILSSAKEVEKLNISTLRGDAELIDGLSVVAASGYNRLSYKVEVNPENSEWSLRHLFTDYASRQDDLKIRQLQSDYKSFMRGKDYSIDHFYEDDNFLIYAEMDEMRTNKEKLKVGVYDKLDGKEKEFTYSAPEQLTDVSDNEFVSIRDVQFADHTLYVTASRAGSSYTEILLLHIDLQEKKITKTISVLKEEVPEQIDYNPSYYSPVTINIENAIGYTGSHIFSLDKQGGDMRHYEIRLSDGKLSELASNENNEILFGDAYNLFRQTDGELFKYDKTNDKWHLINMDWKSNQVIVDMRMKDNLLYILIDEHDNNGSFEKSSLLVVDQKQNSPLYEGEISLPESADITDFYTETFNLPVNHQ